MTDLEESAQRYVEYGWHVVPLHSVVDGVCSCTQGEKCPSPGKHPRLTGWRSLSPTAEDVGHWWEQWPDANVGIATGPSSGIVAIDFDEPNEELSERLPKTAEIQTGRGYHRLYAYPDEGIGNSVKRLAPGVDIRGEGGLIVAPPSLHQSGKRYKWASKRKPVPLPTWVVNRLNRPSDEEDMTAGYEEQLGTAYGRAVLRERLADLVQAEEGHRNDTLFQCAVRCFELVKADQLDKEMTKNSLFKASVGTGLTPHEVKVTLVSAWKRAQPKPPEDSREDEPTRARARGKLLTIEDLRSIPSPQWLVPMVLPEGMTVVYADYGAGKTFLALDLALTIASEGRPIVYCVGEGVSGIASRVDAWALSHPRRDPTGRFSVLAHDSFPRLVRPHSSQQFLEALAEVQPALVVVDTWRRALAGESVNSDEVTGRAIEVLDKARNAWGTSSIVLHHTNKKNQMNPNPSEAGSASLLQNADFAWRIKFDSPDGERTMWNEKAKDWEVQRPLHFQLLPKGNSLVVSPSFSELMDE